MNSLLQYTQREIEKIRDRQNQLNGNNDIRIYLVWDSKDKRNRLLTVIKNAPENITKVLRSGNGFCMNYKSLD